jgi:hypothetical protein
MGLVTKHGWAAMIPLVFALVRGTQKDTKDLLWTGDGRPRCPKCGWQPQKQDRWSCNPGGCGHIWNTFETGGQCPQCNRHWKDTACLRCHEWSPHDEWYEGNKR